MDIDYCGIAVFAFLGFVISVIITCYKLVRYDRKLSDATLEVYCGFLYLINETCKKNGLKPFELCEKRDLLPLSDALRDFEKVIEELGEELDKK